VIFVTSLEAVATYSPTESISVSSYLRGHGFSLEQARMYEHYYGFGRIQRDRQAGLAALLTAAARQLAQPPSRLHRVRYLLHARTMLVAVPYPRNPLHEVRRELGLDQAAAFTVTDHACASGLLAVHLAGQLLAADRTPDALALVLTGEKAFTAKAQLIPDAAVMGEGAAAVLVGSGRGRDEMLAYATRTIWGFQRNPWSCPPHSSAGAPRDYPSSLAEVVRCAVDRARLQLTDIRMVLPHNVNRISLLRLMKCLGLPVSRLFLEGAAASGHCFCADSFISYRRVVDTGRLALGDYYLMISVGLGTTFSAMVFRH
jgi:3-oxoacyl-[acyl-carrier-protein] synthase-3